MIYAVNIIGCNYNIASINAATEESPVLSLDSCQYGGVCCCFLVLECMQLEEESRRSKLLLASECHGLAR